LLSKGVIGMQERNIKLSGVKDATEFVQAAGKCDFDIDVYYNHVVVDGKSILGVLGLDFSRTLHVRFDGNNIEFEKVLDKFAAMENTAA